MRILLERAGKGSISNSRFHLMQPCSPSTQLFGPDPSATPRASIQLATCAGHGFSFFFAWRPTARRSCRAWRVGRPTARRSCRAWQGDLRGRRQQRAPRWVLQRGHPAIGVGQEERAGCEKKCMALAQDSADAFQKHRLDLLCLCELGEHTIGLHGRKNLSCDTQAELLQWVVRMANRLLGGASEPAELVSGDHPTYAVIRRRGSGSGRSRQSSLWARHRSDE